MQESSSGPGIDRGRSDLGRVINPVGLLSGSAVAMAVDAATAPSLADGPAAFRHCEVMECDTSGTVVSSVVAVGSGGLDLSALTSARPPFAEHELSRPLIMGVVNVTPDSFSDGGDYANPPAAVEHARRLIDAGADILDIGGESTRPGAEPIGKAEECDRILPVIEAAVAAGVTVSADTQRAETMRVAIAAGAAIVNDVTALTGDPDALDTIAASDASVILMHMQGTPETMQNAPAYRLASFDIFHWLKAPHMRAAT